VLQPRRPPSSTKGGFPRKMLSRTERARDIGVTTCFSLSCSGKLLTHVILSDKSLYFYTSIYFCKPSSPFTTTSVWARVLTLWS
jgi:hypothetical protein